ncbi:MAG: DUF305 domain-containing protein [Actinobacteria bacterium]|nr:DUF305 domain-containing protein [Actinomycetota bacterium]
MRASTRGRPAAPAFVVRAPGVAAPGVAAPVVAALLAASLLTGCGGSSGAVGAARPSTAVAADPAATRQQDVAFATALAEHHHQTLQLVGLAAEKAESTEVLDLAGRVQTASDAGLREVQALLEGWGEPVPHIEGHTDLGDSIPGVLDAEALAALRASGPAAFETTFLATLATHQAKAVALAERQQASGGDPEALRVAAATREETKAQLADRAAARAG